MGVLSATSELPRKCQPRVYNRATFSVRDNSSQLRNPREGIGNSVKRVLLTGMSGTGKSTVIEELAARGHRAIDTDYGGLSELINVPDDEPTGLEPGQDWVWREDRIQALISAHDVDVLFLGGCSPNQGKFYAQFDYVVLLTAPIEVIVERLASRTNNPYGKRPEEVARVVQLQQTIEPLLRATAGYEIDTSVPLNQVVAKVLQHVDVSS